MSTMCLLLLTMLAPVYPQDVPQELLNNPGFNEDADENGLPDHWSTSDKQVRWREKVFMGKDYEIISQPGTYVLATQNIGLEKGKRYTLTVTCKADEGGLAGALIVHGETKPTREMPLLWNVHPTEDYEDYVRVFTAPNPVATLYIYNIAKTKGTVYYDRVSLREGEPDYPLITQLSFKPIDQPLTDPPETPHIDWASPLPGGPVKAFLTIRNFRCMRQLIELTQRIDLDYDVVHTGYSGDECASETGRRAMKRLQAGYYEVYVIPSRLMKVMSETIKERVEAGAGLVVIEGFGQASKFVDVKGLQEAEDTHYLRQGIPWDLMPEKILSSVQTGSLGKGRVARLGFPMDISRVWGMLPTENSMEAYKSRQFEYWEWWEALFARAILWAAKREGDARLSLKSATQDALTIQATNAPKSATARVILRSAREIRFDGPLVRTKPRDLPLGADGAIQIPVPSEMPQGTVIADVMLLDGDGSVLTWGSFATVTPQSARIVELAADEETHEPNDDVSLSLKLSAERANDVTIRAKLIDAFGRVVSSADHQQHLPAGETDLTVALPLRSPICVHHKAFVQVLTGVREQDSRWVSVFVPKIGPATAASDFLAVPWAPGMSHPLIRAYYAERTRDLGINGEFASNPYSATEHGKPSGGYIGAGRAFRAIKHTPDGVRTRCLSDPAVIEEYTDLARERAEGYGPYGIYAVGISDEVSLTSRHKRHEVCFSEHCQKRYREWLKEHYETLAALNEEWDTAHKSWDEIIGARTEDVRGTDNFSPFVDFRTFMTDVWTDACKRITDAYHEVAPETPVGHTNTFGANPFNGNDYWKLCTKVGFGWGQEYSEAIKGSGHKAIFDLWRSFVETPQARSARTTTGEPAPFFNYGWIGYQHSVAAAHYEPWWLALHGSRGVSYFATNAIDASQGISWALVYPTLSYTNFSMAVKEGLEDLRDGCGKVFIEYEREKPKVALLWSHPSMLVSWCESTADEPVPNERDGTDSYGAYFKSALNFRQHLSELQLDYVYLAPQQILESDVLSQYPMLFLPLTITASDALVDKLETYLEAGGVLVGDLRCLRTDEHGKPFADSTHLTRLFGVNRGAGQMNYGATKLTFVGASEGMDLRGQEIQLYGKESIAAAGATPLATHETGEPAVLVQRHGSGLSVYLNFCLPGYDVATRELIRQIVARAGIKRAVVVQSVNAEAPPRCYERNTFTRGPMSVHAFIRDHRRCSDTDPVRIDFGGEAHMYDMRRKQYVGKAAEVETQVAPGDTALYACLPYRVTGVRVSAPDQISAGAELTVTATVSGEGATIGDHVLHVELLGPQGRPLWHYTRNLLAPGGKLEWKVPLALNEEPGEWTVRVRDVLSGIVGEARLVVTAR